MTILDERGIAPSDHDAGVAPDAAPSSSRRTLLTRALGAGALVAGAVAAGCGSGSSNTPIINTGATPAPTPTPVASTSRDVDILNFALNLEYLEAEYYLRATTGSGLSSADSGGSTATVTGGRAVSFTTPLVQALANELAADELAHVRFLRNALGSAAVQRPALDFTNAFNAAAAAAGIGPSFDPFASELNFLLGSFVFEDVGVTAYKGSARFITNKGYLEPAAGILAVEAHHAAAIRALIYAQGASASSIADKIAALRNAAGGNDEGITSGGTITATSANVNFAVTDSNGRAYGRTTSQVLRVVYLTATGTPSAGGFFPNGLNGNIRVAS